MYANTFHIAYLVISIGLAVWVGSTLHKNGKVFILESFKGDEDMTNSVNHLLLVGFYLVNIGFIALFIKYGELPHDTTSLVESLASKIGIVLIVLGGMHFFNMRNIAKMRSKALRKQEAEVKLSAE